MCNRGKMTGHQKAQCREKMLISNFSATAVILKDTISLINNTEKKLFSCK